jgi:DnaK suppressor protein
LNATSTQKAKPVAAAKASAAKPTKAPVAPAKKPAAPIKPLPKTPAKASAPAPKKTVTTPAKKTTPAPASKAAAPAAKKTPTVAANASKANPAAKPGAPAKPTAKAPAAAAKPTAKETPVVAKAAPVAASPAPAVPAKVAAPVSNDPSAVPVKSGRPSSRLAQLTVPSMAQSVPSTAAKASFGHAYEAEPVAPVGPAPVKKDSKLANNWKTKPVDQLSDAELQAMPDSEYMNEVQMAAFRLKLVVLKRDILSNAGETTEHLREDTSVVPDPTDRATIEEEHALELRTRDRERKLLKKIEQSISRIDAGDYGYCDETGEAIGIGRLLARPTATLSLEAQQRRELKQKMFGD